MPVLRTAQGNVLQLNCIETESPLAEDLDFEVHRVIRSEYSSAITIFPRANSAHEHIGAGGHRTMAVGTTGADGS